MNPLVIVACVFVSFFLVAMGAAIDFADGVYYDDGKKNTKD